MTYVCSVCGEVFANVDDDWTVDDALNEAVAAGFDPAGTLVPVCDVCYRGCP